MRIHIIMLCALCASCQSNNSINQQQEEEVIKRILERESATWRANDEQGHSACWHIQPYSRILVSTPDGNTYDVPPEQVIHPSKMGDGGTSYNSNYKMSVQEKNAWVSHDEASISPAGDTTHSHEIRMLEKVDGAWKLVGQSIHVRK